MAAPRPNAAPRQRPPTSTPPVLTLTLNPAIDLDLKIPAWTREDVARAGRVARQAGGKGVNVARALAALGVSSTAAVALGGPDAAVYRSLLEGVPFQVASLAAPGPTRTNVTISAKAAGGAGVGRRVKVNQPGPRWNRKDGARLLAAIAPLLAGRRWVVLAGTLPPGLPGDFYGRVAAMAHAAGARVAIDAAGEPLRRALAARPDLVRINRQELAETTNKNEPALAAAARLAAMGCRMAAISNGAREALLVAAGQAWAGRPPKIEPQGPLGAGDAMLAGLVAAFLKGKSPAEALRLGLACGAAAASEPETQPPRRRVIQALARLVTVKPRRAS